LADIKLLALDVDGVLTDGGLYFGEHGEALKRFNSLDGYGIATLAKAGVTIVWITNNANPLVKPRAEKLGVSDVMVGVLDKRAALQEALARFGVAPEAAAYMGDDLLDLEAMSLAGFAAAPPNASEPIRRAAHYVTTAFGGDGAVREVCDLILKAKAGPPRAVGVIPVRWASTRLPGKPLADIGGLPMIVRVWRQAKQSRLTEVVVAADDQRIVEACRAHECPAGLTSPAHQSGTDRVAEAARSLEADIVVNIQGDEPLLDPAVIDLVVSVFDDDPAADIVTAMRRIDDPADLANPNIVKVAAAADGRALYFSRAPIPYARSGKTTEPIHFRHVGIYAFRRASLFRFSELAPSPLELAESLEQLRALEHGMRVLVRETAYESIGVDTPDDLERVRMIVARQENGG